MIKRRSVEAQERVITAGLTSEAAHVMLESMPTPDQLMPELEIKGLEQIAAPDDDQRIIGFDDTDDYDAPQPDARRPDPALELAELADAVRRLRMDWHRPEPFYEARSEIAGRIRGHQDGLFHQSALIQRGLQQR